MLDWLNRQTCAQRSESRSDVLRRARQWAFLALGGLLLLPLLTACRRTPPTPKLPKAYPYAADDGTPNLDLFDENYRTIGVTSYKPSPREMEWLLRQEQLDFEREYDNIEAWTEQSVYPVSYTHLHRKHQPSDSDSPRLRLFVYLLYAVVRALYRRDA